MICWDKAPWLLCLDFDAARNSCILDSICPLPHRGTPKGYPCPSFLNPVGTTAGHPSGCTHPEAHVDNELAGRAGDAVCPKKRFRRLSAGSHSELRAGGGSAPKGSWPPPSSAAPAVPPPPRLHPGRPTHSRGTAGPSGGPPRPRRGPRLQWGPRGAQAGTAGGTLA